MNNCWLIDWIRGGRMELGQPLSPTPTRSVQAVSKKLCISLEKVLISYLPSQHLVAMHSSKSDTTMAHVNMHCCGNNAMQLKKYNVLAEFLFRNIVSSLKPIHYSWMQSIKGSFDFFFRNTTSPPPLGSPVYRANPVLADPGMHYKFSLSKQVRRNLNET